MTRLSNKGRAQRIDRLYDLLRRNAASGKECPSNEDLMVYFGANKTSTVVGWFHALEQDGRIRVERFQRGRIVHIVATGQLTAYSGARTPHWRAA
jgi:hypothetical protein